MSEEKVIVISVKQSEICNGKLFDGHSRCSIGHLLHALGVKDEVMLDQNTISDIVNDLDESLVWRLEEMGLIDTNDPGRGDPSGLKRAIDTTLAEGIYSASDEQSWSDVQWDMAHLHGISVDFTVSDAEPREIEADDY